MKNTFLIAAGGCALALGVVGIFLPVLPTTPLVVLAALCFAKGDKRLEAWVLRSRLFGPYIEGYRTGKGITRTRKAATLAFLWAGLGVSFFFAQTVWLYVLLTAVGVGVTVHILWLPTRKLM